jgi:ribose 5-phosphate isomerase A
MNNQSHLQLLANELSLRVLNGQCIGVGTGTTVEAVLKAIKDRIVSENLKVTFVPTSYQSTFKLEGFGLTVLSPSTTCNIDWAFDGADEVDPDLRLLKGRGAAMLHEKIIASRAEKFIVVVTEDKRVDKLGSLMAVPVEVIPESLTFVKMMLKKLGAVSIVMRTGISLEREVPIFTQEGNLILDARFNEIKNDLEQQINNTPGVVENGIFTYLAHEVLLAGSNGLEKINRN